MFKYFSKAKKREIVNESILTLIKLLETAPPTKTQEVIADKLIELVKEL